MGGGGARTGTCLLVPAVRLAAGWLAEFPNRSQGAKMRWKMLAVQYCWPGPGQEVLQHGVELCQPALQVGEPRAATQVWCWCWAQEGTNLSPRTCHCWCLSLRCWSPGERCWGEAGAAVSLWVAVRFGFLWSKAPFSPKQGFAFYLFIYLEQNKKAKNF